MSILDPTTLTVGELCGQILRESGAVGLGQTPSATDINETQARLLWMLDQWERKRWLVPHLVTLPLTSTGAVSYTVGPGGNFDTGTNSVRPARIESAFVRQLQTSAPNQVDYPLEIMQSREDYNRIALKSLVSFPGWAFLDTNWPLASLFVWPVPNANIYAIHISIIAQLPTVFANQAVTFSLPYEYYAAMLYNCALRIRPHFRIPTYPGDTLPGLAKDSLNTLRGANAQIARLVMPGALMHGNQYNIFSDRFY